MKIEIISKNYVIRDRLRELIERKVEKLERYFNKTVTAKVVCSANSNKDRFKMEVTINASGQYVRSEVETDNMYANLDICLARIERQLVKFSEKLVSKKRKQISARGPVFDFFDEIPEIAKPKIVKYKVYELSPITPDQAIDEMELVGNTFFVFLNKLTGAVNVVYKRFDGDYGIIETVVVKNR